MEAPKYILTYWRDSSRGANRVRASQLLATAEEAMSAFQKLVDKEPRLFAISSEYTVVSTLAPVKPTTRTR